MLRTLAGREPCPELLARKPHPPASTALTCPAAALYCLQGQYASDDDFAALDGRMREREALLPRADRMFYFYIPPNIFTAVAGSASRAATSQ